VTQQILIGHSLGGSFLLKYVSEEKIAKTVAGIFLIATPYWGGDGWQYGDMSALHCQKTLLRNYRVERIFFYSRDNEIVPFAHLALYAKNSRRRLVVRSMDADIS
jgi:uncharacterized protein